MSIKNMAADSARVTAAWLKSHLIMGGVVFVLLIIGLCVVNYAVVDFANPVGIFFIAAGLAVFDMVPAMGILLPMSIWAACAALLADNTVLGVSVIVLCFAVMIIRQIVEPFAVGKTMGISVFEEIGSSVAGFIVTGFSFLGLLLGPLVYTIGKTLYINHRKSRDPFRDDDPV